MSLLKAIKSFNLGTDDPVELLTPMEQARLKPYLPEPITEVTLAQVENLWEQRSASLLISFLSDARNQYLYRMKDVVHARREYARKIIIPASKARLEKQTKSKQIIKTTKTLSVEEQLNKAVKGMSKEELLALLKEME